MNPSDDDDPRFRNARRLARTAFIGSLFVGAVALGNAVRSWPDIPRLVPIHFDAAGSPDAWGARSVSAAFALPLMALVLGSFLSGFSLLMLAPEHVPERSRVKLRRILPALATFLSVAGLMTAALVAGIWVAMLRVAVGDVKTLGWWPVLAGVALGAWCMGGVAWLVLGMGPMEEHDESTEHASRWRWQLLYFAPDDRALVVEKRWRGGFTINLGQPAGRWLAAMFAGFVVAMALLSTWLALSSPR